jgi:hypothetical protein
MQQHGPTARSVKQTQIGGPASSQDTLNEVEQVLDSDPAGGVLDITTTTLRTCRGCGKGIPEGAAIFACGGPACDAVIDEECGKARCANTNHKAVLCPTCRVDLTFGVYCTTHARELFTGIGIVIGLVTGIVFLVAVFS